jgi:hypothetical protein
MPRNFLESMIMKFSLLIIANPFSIPAPIEPTALERLMNRDMADALAGLKGG